MSKHEDKLKITLDEFTQIRDVLDAPTKGEPLPANRRWTIPCPDQKTFADYPEAKEKQEKWLKEWTSCEILAKAKATKQANQSSKAT
jgi:hypothetical protein